MIYKHVTFIVLMSLSGFVYSQDRSMAAHLDTSKSYIKEPDLETQLIPLDQIIEIALSNSPILKYDSTMIASKEDDLILQKRRWQTRVSAFGNLSGGNQGFVTNGSAADLQNNLLSGYRYGINFTYPLSEITSRKIYIRKSLADLHSSQFKMDQTEMELRQRIIGEYNRLITTQKLLRIKSSARENALVVQQMADKSFREGVTSLEGYASVSTMTVNAEADYEQVRSAFSSLYLQFEELVGVKLTTLMKKK